MKKYHYVYRLDAPNGDYYVGIRSSGVPFSEDADYTGSGIWCFKMREMGIVLKKRLIASFPARKKSQDCEKVLIRASCKDPKCQNIQCAPSRKPSRKRPRITVSLAFTEEDYALLMAKLKEMGYPYTLASILVLAMVEYLRKKS